MESLVRLTLVLGVITVANCASLQKTPGSREHAIIIARAIDSYNRAPGVTAVFKLLEAAPANRPEDPTRPGQLRFTIKETVCPKLLETEDTGGCAFKDLGLVKECRADVPTELGSSPPVVTCDPVTPETGVRRSGNARECVQGNNSRKCKVSANPLRSGDRKCNHNRPGCGSVIGIRPDKEKGQ